jgi:hypothetical protein
MQSYAKVQLNVPSPANTPIQIKSEVIVARHVEMNFLNLKQNFTQGAVGHRFMHQLLTML